MAQSNLSTKDKRLVVAKGEGCKGRGELGVQD